MIQNATILDGADKQRVLIAGNGAVIEGFIITRGRAGGSGFSGGGGGMLIEGTSPTVRNCIFRTNNITGGRGSAIHVTVDKSNVQGKPLFENVLVYDNGKTTKVGHTVDVTTAGGTFINLTIDNVPAGSVLAVAMLASTRSRDGGWLANRPLSQSESCPSLKRTKVSCSATAPCGS